VARFVYVDMCVKYLFFIVLMLVVHAVAWKLWYIGFVMLYCNCQILPPSWPTEE